MTRIALFVLTLILCPAQEPKKFPDALEREALERTKAATVFIAVSGPGYTGSGSGFVVSSKGFIVTNRHVVEPPTPTPPKEISVVVASGTEAQRSLKAEKVFADPKIDLALLKVDADDLTALTLGKSKDLTETVTLWAMGYPFGNLFQRDQKGPEITINRGNVTSLRKNKAGELELIQIDTQVNPGNSGGPLLSGDGRVYGVITSGIRDSSLRFAIPSDAVSKLLAPRLTRNVVRPLELPETGGAIEFEAEIQEVLTPADLVSVVIEGGTLRKEMDLVRGEKGWTASWTVPELPAEDRRRVEATIVLKDKSVKTAVFKSAGVSVRTEFGSLQIPIADLDEIKFGEKDQPDRISTRRGRFEGRIEPRHIDAEEKINADRIESVRFETKSGRIYQVKFRVRGGTEEAVAEPIPVAVGVPAPKAAPAAARFETRMSGDLLEKRLPGIVQGVKLGGGGRYLFLWFKSLQTIGMFDLERLEIVKHLQLQSEDVLFAVGRSRILICYPSKSRLERWSLETFEKEIAIEFPFQGLLTAADMGWNSDSPAVLRSMPSGERSGSGTVTILDTDRMKPVELDADQNRMGHMSGAGLQIRMSANGTAFTWWRTDSSPSGVGLTRIGESKLDHRYMHDGGGYVLPSEDGSLLFTSNGIYAADEISLQGVRRRGGGEGQAPVLPAWGGPFYLSLQANNQQQTETDVKGSLYLLSSRQKLISLDFPLLDRWDIWERQDGDLTRDRRAWLFPGAKLFVGVPSTRDKLVCRRVDVDDLMNRADIDYLFVSSSPVLEGKAGKEWTYAVQVKSRKGGVKIKLESAPEGMRLESGNALSWLPKEAGKGTVVMLVSDDSGQEVYHSFKITVK